MIAKLIGVVAAIIVSAAQIIMVVWMFNRWEKDK
jgi:hypothetical protein